MNIKVVRVFWKFASVPKPIFNSTYRSNFAQWPEQVVSQTGFVDGHRLYLNQEFRNQRIPNKGVFILTTYLQAMPGMYTPESFYSLGRYNQQAFSIFNIIHSRSDQLELHTNLPELSGFTSFPQSDNHQLGVLHKDKPIRYQTNNRIDNTAAGWSKQRHFLLWDVIMEYTGDITSIDFLRPDELSERQQIIPEVYKSIDERKIIW